jgi:hypothetical protein
MDEGTQQTQALNRERFDVALRDVYQSASDAGDEETQDSLDAVHRALEETPETAPDRSERIESALGRLARARAEITEAIEDLPQDLVGARRTLRETNDQVKALIAEALRSGVIDELLARWTVLRPHVEATPDTRELDQDGAGSHAAAGVPANERRGRRRVRRLHAAGRVAPGAAR